MEFTKPRATLEETLAFCNLVREIGGAEILSALLPGIPGDSRSCIIAKNLNFSCWITKNNDNNWVMILEGEEGKQTLAKIQEKVGGKLSLVYPGEWNLQQPQRQYELELPQEIGEVAEAFDSIDELLEYGPSSDPEDKILLKEMYPLLLNEVREEYSFRVVDGEFVSPQE